jgi:hypothetical protein
MVLAALFACAALAAYKIIALRAAREAAKEIHSGVMGFAEALKSAGAAADLLNRLGGGAAQLSNSLTWGSNGFELATNHISQEKRDALNAASFARELSLTNR